MRAWRILAAMGLLTSSNFALFYSVLYIKSAEVQVFSFCATLLGADGDREYRRKKLRDFGVRPYPMPFRRPAHHRGCGCPECCRRREIVGFQRYVIGAYDKPKKDGSRVTWEQFKRADCRPEKLGLTTPTEKSEER